MIKLIHKHSHNFLFKFLMICQNSIIMLEGILLFCINLLYL